MRLRAIAGLMLAACASAPPPPRPMEPTCEVTPQLNFPGLLEVGRPNHLSLGVHSRCGDGGVLLLPAHVATEVQVAITDGAGHTYPADVVGPLRDGDYTVFDTRAEIAFTPPHPGDYTVSLSFEPGVGRVQQTLTTAVFRGDAPAREVDVAFPRSCTGYGVFDDGTPACANAESGLAIGATITAGDAFVLDGDAFWAAQDKTRTIRKYRRGPAGPEVVREATWPEPIAAFTARGDEAWIVANKSNTEGRVALLQFEADGGSRLIPVVNFLQRPGASIGVAADRVLVALRNSFDGASVVMAVARDGTLAAQSVGPYAGSWADEGSFWIASGQAFENGAIDVFFDADGGLASASVPWPALHAPAPPRLIPASPVVAVRLIGDPPDPLPDERRFGVASLQGEAVRFELFDAGVGYQPVSSATRSHAFARSFDGKKLKIFDR